MRARHTFLVALVMAQLCYIQSSSSRGNEVAESAVDSEEVTRLVFYTLSAEKAYAEASQQITDDLLLHLAGQRGIRVIGQSELKDLLSHEKDKQVLMCKDDQRCLTQLSEVIAAHKVISGHLGRLGTGWMVTLKLSDTRRAVVEAAEAAEGDSLAEVAIAARAAASRLLGSQGTEGRPGFTMTIAAQGSTAAVIDLSAQGVDPQIASSLTQFLSLELKKFEGLSVISRDEIQTMLRFEGERQILTCQSDTSCLVEIGGALGVDFLITGSVGRLGDAYVIMLKLMDIHKAAVSNRVSQSFTGSENDLVAALRFATSELLGRTLKGIGSLDLKLNVSEASVSIDNDSPKPYEGELTYDALVVGKHALSVTAEGYHPLFQETYVFDMQTRDLRMTLEPLPTPWYEQWWVWTAVGAVVVAGVTTGLVLGLEDSAPLGEVTVNIGPAGRR